MLPTSHRTAIRMRKFFHGYYGHYRQLALLRGDYPLFIQLRPSNIDAAGGGEGILKRSSIHRIRTRFPNTRIISRGEIQAPRQDAVLPLRERASTGGSCLKALRLKMMEVATVMAFSQAEGTRSSAEEFSILGYPSRVVMQSKTWSSRHSTRRGFRALEARETVECLRYTWCFRCVSKFHSDVTRLPFPATWVSPNPGLARRYGSAGTLRCEPAPHKSPAFCLYLPVEVLALPDEFTATA